MYSTPNSLTGCVRSPLQPHHQHHPGHCAARGGPVLFRRQCQLGFQRHFHCSCCPLGLVSPPECDCQLLPIRVSLSIRIIVPPSPRSELCCLPVHRYGRAGAHHHCRMWSLAPQSSAPELASGEHPLSQLTQPAPTSRSPLRYHDPR